MKAHYWASETFKHRRISPAYSVSFWANNTACIEDHADNAVIEVSRGAFTTRFEIKWPEDRGKLADLERMFEEIFHKGRQDAKREVREVLGAADHRAIQ